MQELNNCIEEQVTEKSNIVFRNIKQSLEKLETERTAVKNIKNDVMNKLNQKFEMTVERCDEYGINPVLNGEKYIDLIGAIDNKTELYVANTSSVFAILGYVYENEIIDKSAAFHYYNKSLHSGNPRVIPFIITIMVFNDKNVIEYILLDENKKYRRRMIHKLLQVSDYQLHDVVVKYADKIPGVID